jgi:16S rRNA (uracil1498-N3)-methyltransferase
MAPRYFVETPIRGDRATLTGQEAHHLAHVMRAKPADRVTLFDGSGVEYMSQVEQIGRATVDLAVLSREDVDRELPFQLTLGVALPKGDRQKWLVEKAVELGVARLVALNTSRGVAQPSAGTRSRLERAGIEAAKQCGRNRLMEICPAQSWNDYLRAAPSDAWRLVAHPGAAQSVFQLLAEQSRPSLCQDGSGLPSNSSPIQGAGKARVADQEPAHADAARSVFLAVGPEGGLADEEVAAGQQAGWQLVDLGPRILRIETAAVLLVALVTLARSTDLGGTP